MALGGKKQEQTAGENSIQTQVEGQGNVVHNEVHYHYNDPANNPNRETAENNQPIPGPTAEYDVDLWNKTLGIDNEAVRPLRESYLQAREYTKNILDQNKNDFPGLTVNDIKQIDSFWYVADTIIGENYDINPLEGYILGIAFLLLDTSISYNTVGGEEQLRNTLEWKDVYADCLAEKDKNDIKKEITKDYEAICAINENKAKLLKKRYCPNDYPSLQLVQEESYRQLLGEIIVKIVASCYWSIDDVELILNHQYSPISSISKKWGINAQKLACILRCADAGHFEDGRAPYHICHPLNIYGVSLERWHKQSNLGQLCPEKNDTSKLLITSTRSFIKDESEVWNVAYEAVKLFDEELKKSNVLLKSINDDLVFPRMGVIGATSKEELAKYIQTDGNWQPCDFGVHTSNLKYLIEALGGSKLYGENNMLLVVLRELIQNARDAIHARQKIDDSFRDGRITIRLLEDGKDRFIVVEDNGIGMSMDCIKNHLLDFGSSYWKSSLSKYENPGLRSNGFVSVGQFGIGFYSVFMVASSVDVYTKRFEQGAKEAKRIEFPEGLTLSPIISNCELGSTVSTIIRFKLKEMIDMSVNLSVVDYQKKYNLIDALPFLVAGLDTNVFFENNCIHVDITSNKFDKLEWLKQLFVSQTPLNVSSIADDLEFIKDDNGQIRGLMTFFNDDIIWPQPHMLDEHFEYFPLVTTPSVVTIGGLWSLPEKLFSYGFIGFLDLIPNNVNRNSFKIDVALEKALFSWFKQKYIMNYDRILKSNSLAEKYYMFSTLGNRSYFYRKELLNHNIRQFYLNYRSQVEIGTVKGLKMIHYYLLCGLTQDAGVFDPFSLHKDHDKAIDILNDMPDNNFEKVILKLLVFLKESIFISEPESVGAIWANLMLDRLSGEMINWSIVPAQEFNDLFERYYYEGDNSQQICSFLKKYICSTNDYFKQLSIINE